MSEKWKGQTLRVSPDPGMEKQNLYIPDCVVSPNKDGYFAMECRNASAEGLLLGKQVIGIIAPCTPISTREATEELVEAIYADEKCFLATETVV